MTTTVESLRIAARHDESQGRMMNEAADLIEQQQREIGSLRSRANTWNKVWGELRNTQLIKDIGYEHAKYGNCSAASILLEAFETLTEQAEVEQESLGEVRAHQAQHSYLCGHCDALYIDADATRISDCTRSTELAKQHANKVRNGGNND